MTNGIFNSTVSGTPAVSATGSNGADGIDASTDTGTAVNALCTGFGPISLEPAGFAISATGPTGIIATCNAPFASSAFGVHAIGGGAPATEDVPVSQAAIFAEGGPGTGVFATADTGVAVNAISNNGIGVSASGTVGISANGTTGPAVSATTVSTDAVIGISEFGAGVQGSSSTSAGVSGFTETGIGVKANGGIGGVALQVIGKVEVQGNSVGMVTMGKEATTLTVPNPAATPNSLILLTPLDNPQEFLWIGARNAGSFTIDASKALPTTVIIMFLIIN